MEVIEQSIEEASESGASARQLDLLAQARDEDEVTTEMVRVATYNAVDCFEAAGGEAEYRERVRETGLVMPGYVVSFDEALGVDQIDALVQGCKDSEVRWVAAAYQMQPSSRELVGRHVLSRESELRACLESAGISTDAASDGWDLAIVALNELTSGPDSVNCLREAGISGL